MIPSRAKVRSLAKGVVVKYLKTRSFRSLRQQEISTLNYYAALVLSYN